MSAAKKPTILLIEADTSLRRLITLGLQHHDMHVIAAHSLATLSSSDMPQPDLLVVDLDYGSTCDWSSLDLVQSNPQLSSVPSLVLAWEPQPTSSAQVIPAPTPPTQCL